MLHTKPPLMKVRYLTGLMAMLIASAGQCQQIQVNLVFTAVDSTHYVKLDSVRVMNKTQGKDTILRWPDTTLVTTITPGDLYMFIGYATKYPSGMREINGNDEFRLRQNYPNPFRDQTTVSLFLPGRGMVGLRITEISGKEEISDEYLLDKGYHSFMFRPGRGNVFFLSARWNGIIRNIKILSLSDNYDNNGVISYIGSNNHEINMKTVMVQNGSVQESGIADRPGVSRIYTFGFATNISCPGTPTVVYEGEVYNTIQIFSQCWLKKNLNTGKKIAGIKNMTDNGVIEKYCYGDLEQNCNGHGGLYQWDEMMQYTTTPGARGICPVGWHVPSDEEWKVLEGAVDSEFPIGDPEWDIGQDWRGFDAGKNIKSGNGWIDSGNGADLYGFSAYPAGYRTNDGTTNDKGKSCFWFTSTQYSSSDAWSRGLAFYPWDVYSFSIGKKNMGFSVRCLKD
jgi:uncharacterized protein (TIGR02145 family)